MKTNPQIWYQDFVKGHNMISLILKKLFYFENDANYRKMVPYFPYETMADTGTLKYSSSKRQLQTVVDESNIM